MGRNHARVFSLLDDVDLVAIYDRDKSLAESVAAEFGAVAVDSLGEFAEAVDAATVAVPTIAHREVGCQLMEKGVHVLMEKPISTLTGFHQFQTEASISAWCEISRFMIWRSFYTW